MSDLTDLHERIVMLEAQRISDKEVLDEIRQKLNDMNEALTRVKGFIGGLAFIGSCVAVFASFFKDWLLSHLK